jgi:protein TonB
MVHAIVSRSRGNTPFQGLDGNRIVAGAGAVVLNIVLLMLLLVPLRTPPAPVAEARTEVDWLVREEPRRIEPIPVPVEKRLPRTTTPVATPRPVPPVAHPVVEPQPGDITTTPPVPAVPAGAGEPAIEPVMTGAALRYAVATPPPYPRRALRAGVEGTVLLEVLVDTDGTPLEVRIVGSSGDRELDRAAQRHVQEHWRFQPALRDGRPVQAIGRVPIGFSLQ